VEFGRKEPYMMKLNDFIKSNDKVINTLFENLAHDTTVKSDELHRLEVEIPQAVYESSLFKIYDHCMTNVDKICFVLEDNSFKKYTDKKYETRLQLSRRLNLILTEISKNTAGMASGHARKSGWLKKAGISNKGAQKFQKRWVVINAQQILYYKNEGDKKPAGYFNLNDVAKVEVMTGDDKDEKTSMTFILKLHKSTRTTKDKRAYMFLAKTPEECQSWITTIDSNKQLLDEANSEAAQQRKTKHFTIRGGVLTETVEEEEKAVVPAHPGLPTLPVEADDDDDEAAPAAGGAAAAGAAPADDDDVDETQYQDQLNRMAEFLAADDESEEED